LWSRTFENKTKKALKTYFFCLKALFHRCNWTHAIPFFIFEGCAKEWEEKEYFWMSYSLFPWQKTTAKKCKTWQSNVPSIITNVQRLQTINRKATLVLDEGMQTKKKWKNRFSVSCCCCDCWTSEKPSKKIKRTWLSWIKSIRSKRTDGL